MSEPALACRVVGIIHDAADPSRGLAVTLSADGRLIEVACPLSPHRVTYLGLTRVEAQELCLLLERAMDMQSEEP